MMNARLHDWQLDVCLRVTAVARHVHDFFARHRTSPRKQRLMMSDRGVSQSHSRVHLSVFEVRRTEADNVGRPR